MRRQRTAAEIRKKIEALKIEEAAAAARDREAIGAELQKLTGRETWAEIAPLIEIKGGKAE